MKVSSWMLPPLLVILQGVLASSSSSYGKYINTACTATSDCGLDNHLQCINNYCQCDSLTQIYDQSTHKCLLLLRQQCQVLSGTTSEKHHHHYQQTSEIQCVPFADCTNSVCKCRIGYRPSVDFLCKPDYGSPCYSPDDCDDSQGLTCAQGTCQCYNSSWTYQGQFGCVDPQNPQYTEMLRLLNQTEFLLKENKLELKDMFNDLGLQNDPDSSDLTLGNFLASARQDTYNTNDLQFAAQNQDSQSSGVNLQQLLNLFQTFQSLIPRNNNNNNGGGGGGGGRGFFRNLFRGGNQGGGYPEASTTAAPASGYGPPGQPEGMGQRMGLLNSFLNLFNQMIPIVRQLRMRFNPVRFFQNLVMRFSPTTTPAPAPAPAAIHNAPPTIISSSGNYQNNPIFDDPGQPQQSQMGGGQGQGSFRFFMRTRERFRNFLRGRPGGYPAANPPPDKGYGPPGETPPPAEGGDAPPPADAPPADAASSAHANYYTNNNPRAAFQPSQQQQQQQQPHYSTIHLSSNGAVNQQQHQQVQHQGIPQSVPQRHQTQSFGNSAVPSVPSTNNYLAGHQTNPQSFFSSQKPQSNNQNTHTGHQFSGNYNNNNNNNQHHQSSFNGQATSHQQPTFVPHPQPSNNLPHHHPSPSAPSHHQTNNIFDSSTNSFVNRPPVTSGTASPPPPIPHFKLQIPQKAPASTHESLTQNFILSEADDPHPGFTPLSTPSPTPAEQHNHQSLTSFRTSARFERIGHHEDQHQHQNTAAENWRESF